MKKLTNKFISCISTLTILLASVPFVSIAEETNDSSLTFYDIYEMTEAERQALCKRNNISYNSEKDIYDELTGGYVGKYYCIVNSDFLNTGIDSRENLLGFETEVINNKDYYSKSVTELLGLPDELIELEYSGMSHFSSTAYIDSEFKIVLKSDDMKENAKICSSALIFLEMNPNVAGTLRSYLGGGAFMKGDLNSDLQVTIADAVIMQQYLLGIRKWNGYSFCVDINNDDRVDVFDLVLLRKILISEE